MSYGQIIGPLFFILLSVAALSSSISLLEPGVAFISEEGSMSRKSAAISISFLPCRFKSSRNQAPRKSTPGKEGEVRLIRLELKSLADVGLVGMPNAGKSTLINQILKEERMLNYLKQLGW